MEIVKKIGFVILAIMFAIFSLFAFIPTNSLKVNNVYADTVDSTQYQYNGSPLVIPYMEHWNKTFSSYYDIAATLMFSTFMSYNSDNTPRIYLHGYVQTVSTDSTWIDNANTLSFSLTSGGLGTRYPYFNPITHKFYDPINSSSSSAINSGSFIYLYFSSSNTHYAQYWKANVALSWNTTVDYSFNIISVTLGSTAWNGSSLTNYLQYNSDNGWWFRISFYSFDSTGDIPTRTYFLNTQSGDYNVGYSAGRNAGYDSGYSAGVSEGLNTGYSDGYSTGYSAGETYGFNQGLDSANQYTFFSLISAVIDAPISALLGLFDFEVFGFDMKQFILSLLTLSIIFVIIRYAIKGGK